MFKHYTSWIGNRMRSDWNRSQIMAACGILTAIAFTLASVAAQPYRSPRFTAPNRTAPVGSMMAMPLVAPLFLEDLQFSSTLSLVNVSNLNTYATVTVRSLTGQGILQKQIPLPPSSPIVIGMQQLLQEANSTETRGSLVVEQSPELKGMVVLAQLSLTYQGSRASYIDEELAMPDPNIGSSTLRGVARGKAESTLIAISSLSQTTQKIQVDCLKGNDNPTSTTVSLPANATLITNACGGDLNSQSLTSIPEEPEQDDSLGASAIGIQFISSAGPGEFAAFGLTRRRASGDVLFGAVLFNDPKLAVSPSTVFAGVPVGAADLLGPGLYTPYAAVANFSQQPAHVSVSFSRTSGAPRAAIASNTLVRQITLQPLHTRVVSLTEIQGDPSLRNSFVVTSDVGPGEMAASMASNEPNGLAEVELLGKDAQQPENAGGHPWSVAQGNESTLLIFNHTDKGQRVKVNIPTGKGLWEKLIKLSPFETLSVSMSELIKDQVKDDNKLTLPPDLVRGEIVWTMADSKTTTGRLLVSNTLNAMARNFSCSANYNLCGCSITPSNGTMPVNGSATFTGNPQHCFSYYSGQCTGSSSSTGGGTPEYSWSGSGYFTIPTSCSGNQNCAPIGNTPGSSLLTLQAQELGCIYTPQATVNVTPTITQSTPLWFFGLGNTPPSGFTLGGITATLTANNAGNGTFTWTVTNGTSKLQLENGSSTITKTNINTVGITSTSYSTAANDVTVQLQWTPSGGSQMAVNYSLSIDSPYKLVSAGNTTSLGVKINTCANPVAGTDGYISYIPYDIISFFGVQISHIGINEAFGNRTEVYQGNNWPSPTPVPYLSPDGSVSDHACQTQPSGTPPSYPPGSPQSQLVFQISQNLYVGSLSSGSGLIVQEDELEYYQTHGDHTGILSPVR